MGHSGGARAALGLYISRQASGPGRYAWEQAITGLFGWIPAVPGVAVRALAYRLITVLTAALGGN